MRVRLEAFTRYQDGVYAGDAEALHRTRVASRRLRELVPVVGLDGDTSRKLSRRLKKVTRQLGRVRELDVLMVMTEKLGRDAFAPPARAAGAIYVPERLHDVRIVVKKLRYAMELRAEVRSLRDTRTMTVMTLAQDLLGRLHDLEVLIRRARQAQASCPPLLQVSRELGGLIRALENDCRALHARYMGHRAQLAAIASRAASLGGDTIGDRRAVS